MLFVKTLIKHKGNNESEIIAKTFETSIDPGSSSSLVSEKSVVGFPTCEGAKTVWDTTTGTFQTKGKVNVNLKLSELSETAIVTHQFNVIEASLGQCDMIIGGDLANHIGLDTCGSALTV